MESHCGFNLFSLMTSAVNHLLLFSLSIPISSAKRLFVLACFSN